MCMRASKTATNRVFIQLLQCRFLSSSKIFLTKDSNSSYFPNIFIFFKAFYVTKDIFCIYFISINETLKTMM